MKRSHPLLRRLTSLLLFAGASVAIAQEPPLPSDAELRTAYCIPIIQWDLSMERSTVAAAEHQANSAAPTPESRALMEQAADLTRKDIPLMESVLTRLQAYLLPRILRRDPIALTAAQQRAEADLKALQDLANQCTSRCTSPPNHPENLEACVASCMTQGKDISERVKACRNPTWLPF